MYRRYLKRLLDLAISFPAFIIFSPLLLAISLVVRRQMGSPILFRQKRPGYLGRTFTILKFRTMTVGTNDEGILLPDSQRLTRFGRFLRSTSLDELPELINVIKGEMSLVGPRPLLMQYLELYSPEQKRRMEVKPGITGWAQVNGRNRLTWQEKFAHDLWYVDHLSFSLDLKILYLTLITTLSRSDINQPGKATADYFQGNKVE